MKTVDGILREMRELAKEVQGNSISNAYELLMGFADRIEAAAKSLEADRDNWRRQALDEDARADATRDKSSQVGDASALRESVENSNGLLEELALIGEWSESAWEQINENNAALEKPPRNCDKFNKPDKALDAYCEEKRIIRPLPLWYGNEFWEFINWLFDKAKGEEQ